MTREEAIHVVKTTTDWNELRSALQELIPELRESEDERIRKAIMGLTYIDGIEPILTKCSITAQDIRKYLEKQKELKPIEFKNDELVEIIKGEFEGFRRLLKKKGIDYEPQRGYWEGFARLFDSSAREYVKEQKQEFISISEMVSKYRNTDEYDDDGHYKGKPINCMIRAYEQGIRDTLSKVKEQKPVAGNGISEQTKMDETVYKFTPEEWKKALDEQLPKEQKPVINDKQQECPYKDLVLVKNFFGEYKRKCILSNKACDSKKCKQWNELQSEFKNINRAFEDGKKEVVAHPEKYGLQKEQKPADISSLRDWKFIVDAILTEHEGIGQYIDNPDTERIAKKLQKQFSLPQNKSAWKPTQEQIELLEKLSNYGGHYGYQNLELQKLVTQLRKL